MEASSRNDTGIKKTTTTTGPSTELANYRKRLEVALDAGRLGTWEWDVPSGQVAWSPTLERFHGLPEGTFPGTFEAFQSDIHPDDRARVVETIERVLEARSPDYSIRYRILRPDGALRWLEARGRLFLDSSGSPLSMLGVCSDITERKKREDGLRFLADASSALASSLDYETTLRSLARLAVPTLADWCSIYVVVDGTPRRLTISHFDPEQEALGRRLEDRFPYDPDAPHGAEAVIRTGRPELVPELDRTFLETMFDDAEQIRIVEELRLRSYLAVPLEARGRVLGAIVLATAESGRRLDEGDLELAQELGRRASLAVDNALLYRRAQQAVAERERVLAIVSHDLRQPLNTIRLNNALLAQTDSDPVRRSERIAVIGRSVDRATRLIDDLLTASRLEQGKLPIEPQAIDTVALLHEVRAAFQAEAADRGLRLETTVDAGARQVWADRHRLTQVLSNLVANALRAVGTGGRIAIEATPAPDGIRFSVRDDGPGVPQEHVPRLFEPFWRSPGSVEDGAGLGLAICRGIVEAHGGRIGIDPSRDRGATFWFLIPSAPAS